MAALSEFRTALDREANRLLEDSLHSSKNNLQAGSWWSDFNTRVGASAEGLAAILAGGAGVSALLDTNTLVTAGLAIASSVLSAIQAFLKPAEKADAYTLKGARIMALRSETRMFREIDLISEATDDELRLKLEDLRKRYAELNETPPLVVERRHYEKARKSIEAGEADYAIDKKASGGN